MEIWWVHLTAGYLSATLLIWDEGLLLLGGRVSQADGWHVAATHCTAHAIPPRESRLGVRHID